MLFLEIGFTILNWTKYETNGEDMKKFKKFPPHKFYIHYSKYNDLLSFLQKKYTCVEFWIFTVDPKLVVSKVKQKSWFIICPKWVNLCPCGGYVCKQPFIPINPESEPTAEKKPVNFFW